MSGLTGLISFLSQLSAPLFWGKPVTQAGGKGSERLVLTQPNSSQFMNSWLFCVLTLSGSAVFARSSPSPHPAPLRSTRWVRLSRRRLGPRLTTRITAGTDGASAGSARDGWMRGHQKQWKLSPGSFFGTWQRW